MLRTLLLSTLVACAASPSGATCPTSSAPTYGSFGSDFFTKYCNDCHSSTSTDRHSAPSDVNFDTLADIQKHLDGIDTTSAAGPNATNTSMPQLDQKVATEPTQAERELLGQFIACVKEGKN
jgi:uncharacterized membrane protein